MSDIFSTAPLVLVDGSSYLYRAFHALPPLTTSDGRPTGAVRGVINMLRKLQSEYSGSNIVVVFDAKGKTFRDEMFADYKSHRPPMPDDLRAQIEPLHACVKAMGLPLVVHPGVEADDVMGTLAVQAEAKGMDVVISTGDKDMAQLVTDKITLVNTMSQSVYNPEGVVEKFGVPPELIIDYLAIIGDSADNIPGVPGVGPKSATPMLQHLGDMDAIYANLEAIRELGFRGAKKMPEKLIEHKDQAYMSRALATIKLDVELEQGLETLVNQAVDSDKLAELFTDLEFKSWVKNTANSAQNTVHQASATSTQVGHSPELSQPASEESQYELILDDARFKHWVDKLTQATIFAFDTETTSLNYMEAKLVGVSFAVEAGKAAYVPVGHDYMDAPEQLSLETVLAALKPLLEDPNRNIVAQNMKYDMNILANYNIQVNANLRDTMLESYVLDSLGRHDMDSLAKRYLERVTTKFEDVAGKGAKQLTFNQIALEQAGPYAAEDADITLQLHHLFQQKLADQPRLDALYQELEAPLVKVLSGMERRGALIDSDAMFAQSEELASRIQQLETSVHDLAGQVFNLGSPKQLGEILYQKMELPVRKKTAKGAPSTAEEVLQDLAEDYELPKLILQYRSLSKLKSTYTDKLPMMVNSGTGRIHTSYHQAVTATGRLSSSDPNLQNIPIRTEEGRRIRNAFVPAPGYTLVAADYSQIELRIMAHLSNDPGLVSAFQQGLDVHAATASEVFSTPLDQVTTDQRRKAKAINFGLMYGMGAFGLAKQIGVGRHDAQAYMDAYFDKYPAVKGFMVRVREQAAEKGYVETEYGRRLNLPDIKSSNGMRRAGAERAAINAPMQGTAADIIKRAMLSVDRWIRQDNVPAKLLMQVHDELILEVKTESLDDVCRQLKQNMESAASLKVPLIVDIGTGANWNEAH